MITEDCVNCDIAKLLKEKGFNWPVHYVYHYYKNKPFFHRKAKDFNGQEYNNLRYEWYSAPTIQMAMKWLRKERYIGIFPLICFHNIITNTYSYGTCIIDLHDCEPMLEDYLEKDTYEEACEAAIKYCLENLI